jgi:hypothetical protein
MTAGGAESHTRRQAEAGEGEGEGERSPAADDDAMSSEASVGALSSDRSPLAAASGSSPPPPAGTPVPSAAILYPAQRLRNGSAPLCSVDMLGLLRPLFVGTSSPGKRSEVADALGLWLFPFFYITFFRTFSMRERRTAAQEKKALIRVS